MLLETYERFGPVFTLRLLHSNVVFMLGPAANHYILVSHASDFQWREGHFRDLIGLMGDGLLTIDGDFHRRSRRIMLPAFHRENIAASVETIRRGDRARDRAARARARRSTSTTGRATSRCASRCARCSASTPTAGQARAIDAAGLFEEALAFYASDYLLRVFRGTRSPWGRMQQAARKLDILIYAEIAERRASGRRGSDILSLLLDAEDEDGNRLNDMQIRDEVMTLLFAGHDTTTSTISFMFYELARQPADRRSGCAPSRTRCCTGGRPTAAQLLGGELAELEMVLDETLRKYPPAWVGPAARRCETSSSKACRSPRARSSTTARGPPTTCPTSSTEPEAFRPERFTPEATGRAAEGRLRPVRRRLAHVHRDALRPARGADDRDAAARRALALAARRLRAEDPPDADDQPQGGAARVGRPSAAPDGAAEPLRAAA